MNKYTMDAKKIHTGKKKIHAFSLFETFIFLIFVVMLLSLSTVDF